LILGSEETKV